MLQYIPLESLPYSHIPLHHPSHHQYQMHSHHNARSCPQQSIPCTIYQKPIIIHI
ncbi:BTE_collapsed_G0027990.mRNA.1.CDS.1 [Saccharomyces cerevisiae]|nr:BTE_collapsed_G0027990.mRNA.1.CDS.1 [Saccharomyces cerevisiae]